MALSIKSDEADRLARELAAETGETLTEAVETALRERLEREHAKNAASMRTRLARRGILVIVPYRENRTVRRYEDGRHLRRYRHRWIIERTFAWLGSFRRLLVRHERFTSMYCSLLYFASALIALRRF